MCVLKLATHNSFMILFSSIFDISESQFHPQFDFTSLLSLVFYTWAIYIY